MLRPAVDARSVSSPTDSNCQRRADIRKVRRAIATLADDLRALDALIGGIARELPETEASFDVLAEVGEGLRCVKTDLLADAIETLDTLAAFDEAELRRRFERRQEWLEVESE